MSPENELYLDPNTTDVPELVKVAQAQAAELQSLKRDSIGVQEFIDSARTREQQQRQAQIHQAVEAEIYSACDEEFGAQFRKEASKLADDWVANGEVDQPRTQVAGVNLMRKAYAEIAEKHAESKPAERPVHLTLSNIRDSQEFRPGSLDEVAADMGKKMRAGKWDRKAFAAGGM